MAGAAEEYAAECAWALAVLEAGFWSWRICEMPDGLLMLMLELRWARVWMAPPGAGASLVPWGALLLAGEGEGEDKESAPEGTWCFLGDGGWSKEAGETEGEEGVAARPEPETWNSIIPTVSPGSSGLVDALHFVPKQLGFVPRGGAGHLVVVVVSTSVLIVDFFIDLVEHILYASLGKFCSPHALYPDCDLESSSFPFLVLGSLACFAPLP
jgi:hypothetical protein